MSNILRENVKKLQFLKDWTVEQVADSIGYTREYLTRLIRNDQISEPGKLINEKLLTRFPEISQNVSHGTFFTGGNAHMISDTGNTYKRGKNQFIELTGGKYLMQTPLIMAKARAGYISGWGDPEYIEELPQHSIIVDKPHAGTYISFEVDGDSMDDDTKKAIEHGDVVTGRKIDRSLWKSKLHFDHYNFIIVTLDGVQVKQIIAHDVKSGIITCRSKNPNRKKYPDFTVNLEKVIQLFNVVQVTKKM